MITGWCQAELSLRLNGYNHMNTTFLSSRIVEAQRGNAIFRLIE